MTTVEKIPERCETIQEILKIVNEGRVPPPDYVLLAFTPLDRRERFVFKQRARGHTFAAIAKKMFKETDAPSIAYGNVKKRGWKKGDKGVSVARAAQIYNRLSRKLKLHPRSQFSIFSDERLNILMHKQIGLMINDNT